MKNTYNVGMISLGCPKNQVDGEMMLSKLADAGFNIVSEIQDSDVMIVNTCGFIDDAKKRQLKRFSRLPNIKMRV